MLIASGGSVSPGYEKIRDAFLQQFREGYSLGAQLHIGHEGSEVVSLHGQYNEPGYNDASLQIVFSSTKVMSPIVIGLLVERGLLSYSGVFSSYFAIGVLNVRSDFEVLAGVCAEWKRKDYRGRPDETRG